MRPIDLRKGVLFTVTELRYQGHVVVGQFEYHGAPYEVLAVALPFVVSKNLMTDEVVSLDTRNRSFAKANRRYVEASRLITPPDGSSTVDSVEVAACPTCGGEVAVCPTCGGRLTRNGEQEVICPYCTYEGEPS